MGNDSFNMAADETGTSIAVHAGFPNPAADRRGSPLSLDRLLIKHPSSTYFFRVQGHSWEDQGIFDGDIAIIDKALTPHTDDVVIWWQDSGELCLARFNTAAQQSIWGVVSAIIHSTRKVSLHD